MAKKYLMKVTVEAITDGEVDMRNTHEEYSNDEAIAIVKEFLYSEGVAKGLLKAAKQAARMGGAQMVPDDD